MAFHQCPLHWIASRVGNTARHVISNALVQLDCVVQLKIRLYPAYSVSSWMGRYLALNATTESYLLVRRIRSSSAMHTPPAPLCTSVAAPDILSSPLANDQINNSIIDLVRRGVQRSFLCRANPAAAFSQAKRRTASPTINLVSLIARCKLRGAKDAWEPFAVLVMGLSRTSGTGPQPIRAISITRYACLACKAPYLVMLHS